MPCCKLNIFFTEFFHKKRCRGVLYLGEINDKLIIVCEKCKAFNFYERFIWTCPKCKSKFRAIDDDKSDKSQSSNKYLGQDNYSSNNLLLDINEKKEINDKEKKNNNDINNKSEISDNKSKIESKDKEDDIQKIIRKSSLKAVVGSPLKTKSILKSNLNKNTYSSFRRHFRLKTTQSIGLSSFGNSENNNMNENSSNQIQIQDSNKNNNQKNNYNNFKKEKTQVSRFKIPEEFKKENKNQDNENNSNLSQKLVKLNTTENVISKTKSVYMRYKELKLQNKEKDNNEEDNKDENNNKHLKIKIDNNEKNYINEKNNKSQKKRII